MFSLNIDRPDEEIEHDKLASNDIFVHLNQVAETIHDRLQHILKDQEASREKEQTFKEQNTQINSRVMWITIVQAVIIFCSGAWQVYSLRNFLKTKGLV